MLYDQAYLAFLDVCARPAKKATPLLLPLCYGSEIMRHVNVFGTFSDGVVCSHL